jgi:protein SCO1/2
MVIAAFALLLSGVAIWGVSSGGSSSPSADYEGSLMPPNVPVADFTLTDEAGKPVSLEGLKGGPSIVTFLYTDCKDVCPLTAQQIRGAMDSLGKDIPVVAITADPRNDTPAKVETWLNEQHLQGRMHWGLDRDGRRCVTWPTAHLTPEGLTHDLKLLVARNGVCRP